MQKNSAVKRLIIINSIQKFFVHKIYVCVLVMRRWRFYPWTLRMIHGSGGSGNKKMHSEYLRLGRGWIR